MLGVKQDVEKIKVKQELPPPQNQTQLKTFLGSTGYYRAFIPNYGNYASLLTKLLRNNVKREWTEKQ